MAIELWQLTKEEAEQCFSFAFPDNQNEVFVDPSKNCLTIFTKDNHDLHQDEVNLYSEGSIGGTPRKEGADEKIRDYLKTRNVIGYL